KSSKEVPMNRIVIVVMLFANIAILRAQSPPPITLSQSPSGEELASAFRSVTRGQADFVQVLRAVVERGNGAVPGLTQILSRSIPMPDTLKATRLYSVIALEAIA